MHIIPYYIWPYTVHFIKSNCFLFRPFQKLYWWWQKRIFLWLQNWLVRIVWCGMVTFLTMDNCEILARAQKLFSKFAITLAMHIHVTMLNLIFVIFQVCVGWVQVVDKWHNYLWIAHDLIWFLLFFDRLDFYYFQRAILRICSSGRLGVWGVLGLPRRIKEMEEAQLISKGENLTITMLPKVTKLPWVRRTIKTKINNKIKIPGTTRLEYIKMELMET